MQVLCDPSVERIVLVVHLMHLVEEGVGVEQPVPAVEQHVLKVIDEQDVQRKFLEGREAFEPELDALQVGEVDDHWVNDQLVDDEVLHQFGPDFHPVGSFPGPC